MNRQMIPPPAADLPTEVPTAAVPRRERLLGVDVARGVALVGMMAVHAFPTFTSDGTPTVATTVAAGRSAATFVLLAGVGVAFLSGGRAVVQGRDRTAVRVGLAVRAVLIGALGLGLGLLHLPGDVSGILPFYGVLFLLAIPLLGVAPLALTGVVAASIALGPVLLVATADAGLPGADAATDPTPATLVHDPLGLLGQLCLNTGGYPVVVFIAYLCAGLAIGRLDLTSRRVGWWLLGAGAALAFAARVVSLIVLYPLGGLAHVTTQDGAAGATEALLWDSQPSSWWYLADPAPQSYTPVDLAHTLGSAMAVLGAALLLSRVRVVARLLRPLAVAGAMSLTLYSAHLLVLATGVLGDRPLLLFVLMVAGVLAYALLWRRWIGQGPLERVVATVAGLARRATGRLLADRPSGALMDGQPGPIRPNVLRGAAQLLRPLVVAGALALAFWGGAYVAAAEDVDDTVSTVEESSVAADLPASPDPDLSPVGVGAPPAPSGGVIGDVERYCTLSSQIDDLDTLYPDQPETILRQATPQLDEIGWAAPAQIRPAVLLAVADIRAEGGAPAVTAPDAVALVRAEMSIDAFEEARC